MAEMDVSLAVASRALEVAGLEVEFAGAPEGSAHSPEHPAIWVKLPGEDAYAIVLVVGVVPGHQPGAWREPFRYESSTGTAYYVGFHERPFRTRGHGYGSAVEHLYSTFAGDVVSAVREWSTWEQTWSVTPLAPPARSRLLHARRLAASKSGGSSIPVTIDLDPMMVALLSSSQAAALQALVDELFIPGLQWRFPRDKAGRKLAARAKVLLHECAPPANAAGSGVWLVVDGPEPRADQTLTVRLARVKGRGAVHRWDSLPEYWRSGPRTLGQLWGIGDGVTAAFIDKVTGQLLAGEVLNALTLCGVGADRATTRLLSGLPDCFALRAWTDIWVAAAIDVMAGAAPWRWLDAVRPKQRPHRIRSLGGFNPSRRPGLFIEQRDGAPLLTFDQSATPLVAPEVTWRRDPDYDLVRLGLISPEQIPLRSLR